MNAELLHSRRAVCIVGSRPELRTASRRACPRCEMRGDICHGGPEESLLYAVVAGELETFLATERQRGHDIPGSSSGSSALSSIAES